MPTRTTESFTRDSVWLNHCSVHASASAFTSTSSRGPNFTSVLMEYWVAMLHAFSVKPGRGRCYIAGHCASGTRLFGEGIEMKVLTPVGVLAFVVAAGAA